jgi:hypothetical protein
LDYSPALGRVEAHGLLIAQKLTAAK